MLDRTDDISIATENWLAQFENALAEPDSTALSVLFHPDSHWRDVLALSWDIQTVSGADAILTELNAHAGRAEPAAFAIDPQLGQVRSELESLLKRPVRMSGSGSSLFSLYDQRPEAQEAARLVTERHNLRVLPVELAPVMPDLLNE